MAHAIAAGDRLPALRAWWRIQRPPPPLLKRLETIYTALLVSGIFGALVYGTARSALGQVITAAGVATYGPAAAVLALLVAANWGVFQGPVVFAPADVALVLGAPLSRRALTARRLVLAHGGGAALGVAIAAVLLVGLGGADEEPDTGGAVALLAGAAAIGALGVSAAWAVQRSARAELVLRRTGWPVAVAAVVLGALDVAPGAGDRGAWLGALAAVAAVAIVAAAAAVRGCGHCHTERHARRAEARVSAVASLASFDARTARQGLQAAATPRRERRARRHRLPLPTWAAGRWLLFVWRDVVAAAPGRLARVALFTGAGAALWVLESDRLVAVAVGGLVAYAGAAVGLGPLRAELDMPDRPRVLLRQPVGDVLLAHTFVPTAVGTTAAALVTAGCAIAGAVPDAGTALAAILLVPAITGCAAMSARRGGRVSERVMSTALGGDPNGGLVIIGGWMALWPAAAGVLAAIALAAGGGAVIAVAATAALVIAVRRDPDQ